MKKIVLCHGDVTFYEGDKIPSGAKKVIWEKGFIVEKGEGVNTHTLETECEIYIDNGRMYFKEVKKPIEVNHAEHGRRAVITKTGISYTDIERVFDYEDMEAKKVID